MPRAAPRPRRGSMREGASDGRRGGASRTSGRARSGRARRAWSPAPVRPPLDREEAKRLYVEEGLSATEIARRMGYAPKTALKAIREQGLAPRSPVSRTGKWAPQLYSRWKSMRAKCRRKSDPSYRDYGARGVGICAEWERFPPFHAWALQSGFRPGLDLALIDRRGDFSPRNCRWQPRVQTVRRSMVEGRRAVRLRAFGETKTIQEWARDRRCKVTFDTLRSRLSAGHSPEAALVVPIHRLHGIAKPARPKPRRKRPQRPKVDWARVERRFRARPVPFAALARELGVAPATVAARLGHLAPLLRDRPHGFTGAERTKLRGIWRHLVRKSEDRRHPEYRYAGAKHRRLCRAWQDFERFAAWAAASGYRPGLLLGRVDQLEGWSPANCRWMSRSELSRLPKFDVKPRRVERALRAFGESKSLPVWARDGRCAVSKSTLERRLLAGWPPETALTEPPEKPGPPPRVLVTAFGETRGLVRWTRDPRCRVGLDGLRDRIQRGVPPEEAITTPGHQLILPPVRERKPRSARKKTGRRRGPCDGEAQGVR